MTSDPTIHCWQSNLDALRQVDPPCAEQLANVIIPEFVQPSVGRDGQPTWRIQRGERVEWFGRTSMPTVSAEGLLGIYKVGAGNTILAGIGSGLEAKGIAERLGRNRSVVVLENDPLNLALALRLWDMSAPIVARQIILLLAKDLAGLEGQLLRFCREHPGFDLPDRMLGWPWRDKPQTQAYRDLIGRVAAELHAVRGQTLVQQVAILEQAHRAGTAPDAVAVLSGVPTIVTRRLAEWLAAGAEAAGMAAATCCAQTPLTAGPLAGLAVAVELALGSQDTPANTAGVAPDIQAPCAGPSATRGAAGGRPLGVPTSTLADKLPMALGEGGVAPDKVHCRRNTQIVLLEQCRNHWPLRQVRAPLISWLVGADPSGDGWQFAEGSGDLAVVSTDRQREQLMAKGWPSRRIVQVPAFVTPMALEMPLDGPREGILLLSDLPPDDAAQAGIALYSQKTLWDALRERLERQGDSWTPQEAQRWLLTAQSQTGIDLADLTVQEEFLGIVRNVLAPAVILRRTAKAILDAGLPLRVAGRGWDALDRVRETWDGLADDPQRRLELLSRAKVAVVGQCRPGQGWMALEAAAAGAAIMARNLWEEGEPARLFETGKQMIAWRTQQELTERARSLLKSEALRVQMVQRARQRAAEEHSATVRMRQVIKRVLRNED
jgi:hypothetical protein